MELTINEFTFKYFIYNKNSTYNEYPNWLKQLSDKEILTFKDIDGCRECFLVLPTQWNLINDNDVICCNDIVGEYSTRQSFCRQLSIFRGFVSETNSRKADILLPTRSKIYSCFYYRTFRFPV